MNEVKIETAKAVPAVAGAAAYGVTLNEAVAAATLAYIVLQAAYLIWKWRREARGTGSNSQSGNARASAAVGVALAGVIAAAIGYTLPHTSGFEGRAYVAYPDLGGVMTACDGATKGIKLDYVYTDKECDAKTAADLQHAADVVKRYVVPEVAADMPVTRWAAFIDWVYNLGEGNFRKSTMLKKLNAGDWKGACMAIMDWMYVAGKDCRLKENKCGGIPARREWEMNTCLLPAPAEPPPRPWWKFWEAG